MSDAEVLWSLNRGSGVVLTALLTLVTGLGAWSTGRAAGGRVPGFLVPVLHRNLSVLALALLLVHAGSAAVDSYVDIRWWQAVVPWQLGYRAWPLAAGVLACDVLLVVALSSLLRRFAGRRVWRSLHGSAYVAWALGVAHGVWIGTDTREPWAAATLLACAALVGLVVVVRLTSLLPAPGPTR